MQHETRTSSAGSNSGRTGAVTDNMARCMTLLRELAAARSAEDEARCREQLRALPGWNA